MSDTDIYRVMFTQKDHPGEWRKFYSRQHGEGFYTKLSSAQNAIKQMVKWVSETKIQKLVPAVTDASNYFHLQVERVELEWVDVDA